MSDRSATELPKTRLNAPAVGLDLVSELRSTLERAGELVARRRVEPPRRLRGEREGRAPTSGSPSSSAGSSTAESDVKELASRLVDSEHQGGRLMNLYVATYQLHATLDPAEVQATIAEIAINLLGADQFVLLLRRDEGEGYEIALLRGDATTAALVSLYDGESYKGGDPMVDQTLRDGVLRLGPDRRVAGAGGGALRGQNESLAPWSCPSCSTTNRTSAPKTVTRLDLDVLADVLPRRLFRGLAVRDQGSQAPYAGGLVRWARGEGQAAPKSSEAGPRPSRTAPETQTDGNLGSLKDVSSPMRCSSSTSPGGPAPCCSRTAASGPLSASTAAAW